MSKFVDCGNATLPYPHCKSLITYCDNHNINIIDWCNCMINPSGSMIADCDTTTSYILAIIVFGFIGIMLISFVNIFVINKKRLRPITTRPNIPIPVSMPTQQEPDPEHDPDQDLDLDQDKDNENETIELIPNYKQDDSIPPPSYAS